MENIHFKWTPSLKPIETVEPGEKFRVRIPDSSTMQIRADYSKSDMHKIDASKFDGAVGPIFIKGVEPGDTVEISLEKIDTGTWGWTAILKDFGLLKGQMNEELVIWDLQKGYARSRGNFLSGVSIPLKPFLGVIGLAPKSGEYGMIPPQYFGGNMDNRLNREGAKLYLPASQKGGLLSFADPHGAQGDGEVCGTAIETSAEIVASVRILKGTSIRFPRIVSHGDADAELLVSMGIAPDLNEASKIAVNEMIEMLDAHGFSRQESYALCSVAGNLRISEIVDEPNFVVSVVMPAGIASQRSK